LTLFRRRGIATLALGGAALLLPVAGAAEPVAEAAEEYQRALELEANTANGLKVYRVCAQCHQPEGWGVIDGSYPQLAGQHRKVIIKQLADIRACRRGNEEMYHYTTAEEIGGAQSVADVAGYIDTLEISIATGKGSGDDLERGAALYGDRCARCHGAGGEGDGDGEKLVPRLQSQHYAYLLRQLQAIRDGKRANAEPEMVDHVKGVSDADARAILDHMSRSEPLVVFQAPPGWTNPDFPPR
jgi:cytochrome c553